MSKEIKRLQERRQVERRAPKRGVTVRHGDDGYIPKRVRMVQCGAVVPHPDKQKPSKNWELLSSFVLYCNQHPNMSFWQALRSWSGVFAIKVIQTAEDSFKGYCTYHWKTKNDLPKASPSCIMTSDREYVRAMVKELCSYLRGIGENWAASAIENQFIPKGLTSP